MPAIMQLDQAGLLPAGTPGLARTDGLDTGALVTVTSTGGGTTHSARLLWVPPDDTTAVGSWVQASATSWTFSPTARVYGPYRIELIVDEGLPSEAREIRIFGVRRPGTQILAPAYAEVADPTASLANAGPVPVLRSENNEPYKGLGWTGWWEFFDRVDELLELLVSKGSTWRWFEDFLLWIDTVGAWQETIAGGATGAIAGADGPLAVADAGIGHLILTVAAGGDDIVEEWASPSIAAGHNPRFLCRIWLYDEVNTKVQVGLRDGVGPASYAYLEAGAGAGDWNAYAGSLTGGANDSALALGAAASLTWYLVAIEVDTVADEVRFYVDGVLLATIATANCAPRPGDKLAPFVRCQYAGVGAGGPFAIDWIEITGEKL